MRKLFLLFLLLFAPIHFANAGVVKLAAKKLVVPSAKAASKGLHKAVKFVYKVAF